MAFVVPTKPGRYEIRESRSTSKGPRSHTLTSFTELTDEVISKARAKAVKPPTAVQLRKSARRAGAPVAQPVVERAARALIAELARGRRLEPPLKRLLIELLTKGLRDGRDASPSTETAHSMALWVAATPEERGKALVDLLMLADALPAQGRKDKPLRFPRLDSSKMPTSPLSHA
jgi:hypothetical protein